MPRSTPFRTRDDYFIPGTSVLRNKFTRAGKPHGETDPDRLRVLEEAASGVRIVELRNNPLPGRFDYDHMKAIHRYIFQDVYEWGGQERVAPVGFMTKDGHSYYGAGPALTQAAEREYARLAGTNYLRGLNQSAFVDALAESWGELNVVHSFRAGNTRTQFVFYSQLAKQAGYQIDVAQFAPGSPLRDDFVRARFHSQDTGRNDRLAAVLGRAVTPLDRDAATGPAHDVNVLRASFPLSAKEAVRSSPQPRHTRGQGTATQRGRQGTGTDQGPGRD